jgi:hypothetical protein
MFAHICLHQIELFSISMHVNVKYHFANASKYVRIKVSMCSKVIEFNTQSHENVQNAYASFEINVQFVVVIVVQY